MTADTLWRVTYRLPEGDDGWTTSAYLFKAPDEQTAINKAAKIVSADAYIESLEIERNV